jgi:uncharacterized protein YbjT (DUF2867 family)
MIPGLTIPGLFLAGYQYHQVSSCFTFSSTTKYETDSNLFRLSVLFYLPILCTHSFDKKLSTMSTQQFIKSNTLVVGGKGKTGSRVVARLQEKGWPVTIASRSGERSFDWADQSTWEKAVKGMANIYISYYPDLAVPGSLDAITALIAIAQAAGVQKLVFLSGRGEKEAQDCEQVVITSGIDWTIVRASWFFQNFSEGHFLDNVLAGHLAIPVGDVQEPFIDAEDIAEIAVAAITEAGHSQKLYEVTGPRLLTFKEAAAIISKATGRELVVEQIAPEAYKAMLHEYQLPADMIWLITYLFSEVLDGRNAGITHDVEAALGKSPRDFADYVQRTAATGIWDVV